MTDLFSDLLPLEEASVDPAAPAAGHDTIFFRNDGRLYQINPSGLVLPVGTNLIEDRAQVQSFPVRVLEFPRGTVANAGSGIARVSLLTRPGARQSAVITSDGANSHRGPGITSPSTIAAANQTDSAYSSSTTAAAINSASGVRSTNFNWLRRTHNPVMLAWNRTSATVTGARFAIGLFSAQPLNVDSQAGNGISGIFFRATPAGNWIACTSDGATQSETDTGIAVATNTPYLFSIRYVEGLTKAFFSINGGTEIEKTVNLPASGTNLGFACWIIATTASARAILISRVSLEWGNPI